MFGSFFPEFWFVALLLTCSVILHFCLDPMTAGGRVAVLPAAVCHQSHVHGGSSLWQRARCLCCTWSSRAFSHSSFFAILCAHHDSVSFYKFGLFPQPGNVKLSPIILHNAQNFIQEKLGGKEPKVRAVAWCCVTTT